MECIATFSKDRNIELESKFFGNFKNTCRLCLYSENVTNIFNMYYKEHRLSDLLYYCTSIQVLENDSFTHICLNCVTELINVFEFIQKCCGSDEFLKSMALKENKNLNKVNGKMFQKCNINDIIEKNNEIRVDHDYNKIVHLLFEPKENKFNGNTVSKSNNINMNYGKPDCYCENQFTDNNELLHKTPKKLKCIVCSKKFSQRLQLTKHICTHETAKPYRCEICSSSFSLKRNMKRHQMIHTGEKPYVCDICGKGFIQKVNLHEHRRIHTGEKPYICNHCGKKFARVQDLKVHLARHSDEDDTDLGNNEDCQNKSLQCNICKKTASSMRALRLHKSINHRKKSYLCSVCGKGFVAKQGLLTHKKTHTGEKPFACEFCEKKFAHKTTLKDHILTHTGEKPRVCKVCHKGFIQHHHLVHHMRTHSGEKPYNCTFCEKSFALKANLTVHIRTHTGETPYVCDICCVGFYDSSSLKKHKLKNGHNFNGKDIEIQEKTV